MYLDPEGYLVITDGWGVEEEHDTYKCRHCQHTVKVWAGRDPKEFWCRKCSHEVCGPNCPIPGCQCARKPCEHFEAKLDRNEATEMWLADRFAEKLERASDAYQYAAIERQIARQRFLKDMGL